MSAAWQEEGPVAIVTGGSRGIGRAVAAVLGTAGARIVVHGASDETVDRAVDELELAGIRVVGVSGPIDDPHTSAQLADRAIQSFGRIDHLVTSAGIQRYGDAVSTTHAVWDEVMAVNVSGVFHACHYALPHIRQSKIGSVTIVSSVQATATQNQVAAYTASKGALVALARALAVDEASFGVRVNSVSPGSVDTPMLRDAASAFAAETGLTTDAVIANWGTAHALGRVARAEEVAEVVAFLAGPRASFVTGSDIRVDGGLLARLAAGLPLDTGQRMGSKR